MWPKRSRKAIPKDVSPARPARLWRLREWCRLGCGLIPLLAASMMLLSGCGDAPEPEPVTEAVLVAPPPGDATFSLLSFNLNRFGFADRSGDGQAVEMKPEPEQEAIFTILADVRPDILALQELGGGDVFEAFQATLSERGLEYPFATILEQEGSDFHLALLSRFPFTSLELHTADRYTADGVQVPVKRGFIEADIAVSPTYQFRLILTQLKSKAYHPIGHSEMRRNEARLLTNLIRRYLDRERRLNLMVVGDFADHISSAPLRTITGNQQQFVRPLPLADRYGDTWTHFDADTETYHRYDYMMVSAHMWPEFIPESSGIVRHPLNAAGSNRRPLLAVFHARDLDPRGAAMLPAYEDDE